QKANAGVSALVSPCQLTTGRYSAAHFRQIEVYLHFSRLLNWIRGTDANSTLTEIQELNAKGWLVSEIQRDRHIQCFAVLAQAAVEHQVPRGGQGPYRLL